MMFLVDDGVDCMFDWYGGQPYTVFEARAVWEQVRTEVWRHELRDLWPPVAALKWDAIGELTRHRHPHRPYEASEYTPAAVGVAPGGAVIWSAERVREAVEADIGSVEAFRHAKPAAAAEIADELDAYVEDLRMMLTIAEELGDQLDECGYPFAARSAWSDLERRRRDQGLHSAR